MDYLTPILSACDPPEYTAHPAMGGDLIVNPVTYNCRTVGVDGATWSGVKRLYAD